MKRHVINLLMVVFLLVIVIVIHVVYADDTLQEIKDIPYFSTDQVAIDKFVYFEVIVTNTGEERYSLRDLIPLYAQSAKEVYFLCVSVDEKQRCYTVDEIIADLG